MGTGEVFRLMRDRDDFGLPEQKASNGLARREAMECDPSPDHGSYALRRKRPLLSRRKKRPSV
ncbi:hypothetical protein CDO26_30260 (plasmid) [Sinorhizobium meliloti]|nr:hypothetical protein CDO26_30260 [Sinorhizobium meliloti]